MADFPRVPHEVWDEPWEGLSPDDAPWEWDEVSEEENGETKNPPNRRGKWVRWYFIYHKPTCTNTSRLAPTSKSAPISILSRESGSIRIRHRGNHSMSSKTSRRPAKDNERKLRRRVFNYFKALTEGNAQKCFNYIDPRLIEKEAVDQSVYQNMIERFKQFYQKIDISAVRILLVPRGSKRDPRAFACVWVIWFDAKDHPHFFRERWVMQNDEWFTRVLGYLAHENIVEE